MLVASDGVSHKSGEWEVEFNFNPTSATQDDIIFGSYSKSKQNDLKSSPVDENDEFDENFGEFKDASSETGSKHEVLYHFDLISFYSFSMLKYVEHGY